MIELKQVSKYYGVGEQRVAAVEQVDLTVKSGNIFGVIGPSGAGKSSLIRCVNLLERPSAGEVWVDGQDLCLLNASALREARKKIGMIFQGFNLLSSSTVYDNVALPLVLAKHSKKTIEQRITPLLELVDMRSHQHKYPSELSGGQKQRVAIARALASKPSVLLSDEATSALDPRTTHAILQLMKNINEQLGLTILLITHEMDVAKEICHEIAIMQNGKVIEQADVIEFFANPQTALAKEFVCLRSQQTLPESVAARLVASSERNTNPLLLISFLGGAAQEPLISELVQQHKMRLNILQANIEPIRDRVMGTMVIEVTAPNEKLIEQGLAHLKTHGVHVEVIGYVKQDALI